MGNSLKDQHYKNMGIMLQMDTLTFEAESVAYTVCQYFGLDTSDYSFPYIAGWSSSMDIPVKDRNTKEVEALYSCFYNIDLLNYFP